MSDISESCTGTILMADFVIIDTVGKANIVGGGVSLLGFEPQSSTSTPFGIFVQLTALIPATHDTGAAMEIILTDQDGQPVALPGPAGPQVMRIAQNVDFAVSLAPGLQRLPKEFPGTASAAIQFSNGLPIVPGKQYSWVVKIDHQEIAKAFFMIPLQASMPVVG